MRIAFVLNEVTRARNIFTLKGLGKVYLPSRRSRLRLVRLLRLGYLPRIPCISLRDFYRTVKG
jgi:hypothetical protein